MTRAASNSRGQDLVTRLFSGQRDAEQALRPGARRLPILRGLTPTCQFARPMENVLTDGGQVLVDSGRIFRYGNAVVLELEEHGGRTIQPLVTSHKAEGAAAALLSNVLICEIPSADPQTPPLQFPPPPRLVELLLNHEPTLQRLPEIRLYATRSVFDENFLFRGPGWHADVNYLVHGPEIEPCILHDLPDQGPALQRLPPHLRRLLGDFCLRSDADVVNAVGAMLTGLLMSSFIELGKPVCLLDGNQPGVGKTLLARAIGVILDGVDPRLIHYTPDEEELAKRICATLRGGKQAMLIIDNAKVRVGSAVSSPVIEANSMAPQISLRILGQSANYQRPNDLLWFLTMNGTQTSADIVSRGLPIRFRYEGDPGQRDFRGRDPIMTARRHRCEILGELAGMVVRWNQAGRPRGVRRHRCTRWAEVIGGILVANNLPEFLTNLDEAAAEFNTALDELAALAEAAASMDGFTRNISEGDAGASDVSQANVGNAPAAGRPVGEWESVFHRAQVLVDEMAAAKSQLAKATRLGNFLAQHLDREVLIEVNGYAGRARLCVVNGRSRQRTYYFYIRGDVTASGGPPAQLAAALDDGLGSGGGEGPSRCGPPEPSASCAESHGDSSAAGGGNQEEW